MTTLIVGCGYLGRRVGMRLVALGDRVLGTTRSSARGEPLAALGIEPVIADVLAPDAFSTLPPFDRVLYCVGFDRSAGRSMREVYVDGLRRFLDRLPRGVTRLVYASSTGVYGQDDGGWVDEGSAANPSTESGRVVLDAECEIRRWDRSGVSVIVRYVGLYGPGRIIGQSSLERGEPFSGNPGRWLNLIHIEDAASIAVACLGNAIPPGQSLYVAAADRPVRRREYYEMVATALETAPPQFRESEGTSVPEEPDKRASNARVKADFGLALQYPDVATGLAASLAEERSAP